MSTNCLKEFDSTIQKTNTWLHELMVELAWDDRHRAYHALRAVLHALRDRLPVTEAVQLGAQLPMLVRGFFYEGWHPADKPLKERSMKQFLVHVTEAFLFDVNAVSEEIARAVFRVLSNHVTAGEIDDVRSALPADIRQLWD